MLYQNMAQRHQTLFPRRTSGHAHQHGGKKGLARETNSSLVPDPGSFPLTCAWEKEPERC